MYRQEWIDEIADIYDLVRFCWDNGYDGEVENVYSADSRNDCINDEINSWGSDWTNLRDYLSDLEDSDQYDYWLRDDYDGTWTGIGNYEFNELKEQVLETLDNDEWFDVDEEDVPEAAEAHAEPEESDEFEELEPGNIANAMANATYTRRVIPEPVVEVPNISDDDVEAIIAAAMAHDEEVLRANQALSELFG